MIDPTSPSRLLIAWTTVATEDEANALAEKLVALRLAACVQVSTPVTSVYRWAGTIQREAEWRLTIKTTCDRWADLQAFFNQHHPYEVPQLIAVEASAWSATYGQWVQESLLAGS